MTGCVYCGLPRARLDTSPASDRRLPSCVGHVDLLAVDPAYDLAGELAAIAYPALSLELAPSVHRREGPAPPPATPLATSQEVL